MIISSMRHWESEKGIYAPVIEEVLAYLASADLSRWECGKYPIKGESIFMLIQEMVTQSKEQRRPESHEKYIDIQYLLEGEEKYGAALRTNREDIFENLLETRDVILYSTVADEIEFTLSAGMFAIFSPADIHRPGCSVQADRKIRKAVVKIDKDLMGRAPRP